MIVDSDLPNVSKIADDATRMILVRHGESLGNMHGVFLGHTDLDLSPHGYLQAKCVCKYIAGKYSVDAVYASDLQRARNTVAPLAKTIGVNVISTPSLREINAGDWENLRFDDIAVRYAQDYECWKTNIGIARCTNGESVAHMRDRVVQAVSDIAQKHLGQTVCIGTHATPIRSLMTTWSGLTLEHMRDIEWPINASVTVVLYLKNGTVIVEEYANASFLSDLRTGMNFGHTE